MTAGLIGAALAGSLVVLAAHNLGVERLPGFLYVPACVGSAATLVALAGCVGIGAGEVGLSMPGPADRGLGLGVAVGGAAALLVVAAGRLPVTRPLFADRRVAGVGPRGTAYLALMRIPMGTVLVEEVAFRGVLLALLDRLVPLRWAVAVSCLAFGLWHVVPVKATLRTNGLPVRPAVIGAAVVATAVIGAGFCWLRLATGGLAAPAIVHASTTATATVVAASASRRATGSSRGGSCRAPDAPGPGGRQAGPGGGPPRPGTGPPAA